MEYVWFMILVVKITYIKTYFDFKWTERTDTLEHKGIS